MKLFGNVYHRTLYIHSVMEVDDSTRIVSRNESIDMVPAFMSRFWDKHLFFMIHWVAVLVVASVVLMIFLVRVKEM